MYDIKTIGRILKENRTIAVIGLSANWYRPSYFAAKYLQDHGYRIIPVNPSYDEILGEKCYPSLSEIPETIEVVQIFRKPEEVPKIVEQAIEKGAGVIWMQIGVISEEAEKMAKEAGLDVVMDRCMKIEHARLFGGLHFVGVHTGLISSKRQKWLPY